MQQYEADEGPSIITSPRSFDDDDDVQTATPTDDDDAPSHALQVTETPATPMHDVTRDTVRRGLHLSEGGTTAHGQRAALKLCGTSKKTAG
jgi:hypothetical protein